MANDDEKNNLGETRKEGLLVPVGPGKSVLMPSINTKNIRPSPELILEDRVSGCDEESAGFNPYDTAVLYNR